MGDRSIVNLSLLELFQRWQEILVVQADDPPATYGIYRLLLAVVHAAYRGPQDTGEWRQILRDNGFRAIAYLNQHCDLFDIGNEERPFLQDPALPETSATPFYNTLAYQPEATPTQFCAEHQYSGFNPSLPRIARGLVRIQSMDLAGLRAFYPGYSGTRSCVATPSLNAANVFPLGVNLRETLLLNLVPYFPSPGDVPTWELPQGYGGMPQKIAPTGYLGYLTYPWRRIRWVPGQGIAVTVGNTFPDDVTPNQWEPAIAYRDQKMIRYSPDRAVWRNVHAFCRSADQSMRPRVLDWVSELAASGLIQDSINLMVIGFCADKAKPIKWDIESLSIPTKFLINKEIWDKLQSAVQIAADHEQVFRSFAGSPMFFVAETLKMDAKQLANSLRGTPAYWATVQQHVPDLFRQLATSTDLDGVLLDWLLLVQRIARQTFTKSITAIHDIQAQAVAINSLRYWLNKLEREGFGESQSEITDGQSSLENCPS